MVMRMVDPMVLPSLMRIIISITMPIAMLGLGLSDLGLPVLAVS